MPSAMGRKPPSDGDHPLNAHAAHPQPQLFNDYPAAGVSTLDVARELGKTRGTSTAREFVNENIRQLGSNRFDRPNDAPSDVHDAVDEVVRRKGQ